MQYAEYEGLIAGAMQNTFMVFGVNGVGAPFTGTMAPTTITASVATSGASIFSNLQLGQWFKLIAPTDANNGKLFRVSTTVAPSATVITLDASTPASVAASIANCTVASARIVNGNTQASFSLEKQFLDVVQFLSYRGMTVGKMNLNLASAALVDGSFEFMGKDVQRGIVTKLPGTPVASYSYDIQNAVRGIGNLWEAGVPLTSTFIKSMTIDVNNNLRGQKAIANLGNVGIGAGGVDITGNVDIYFADGAIYDKCLADTYTSLIVSIQDAAGNGYVFTLPRVLLMSGKVVASGENQDVLVNFTYSCFSDDNNATAALKKTIFIDRVGVAVT